MPDKRNDDALNIDRKYQIFISSTFSDLAEQRRMVLDATIDRGHMPIALERFSAADREVRQVIHKAIENSQIYIVILGYRYGEMANDDFSFTHLEYRLAAEHHAAGRIIVVPFLLQDDEVKEQRAKLRKQLVQFKARLALMKKGTPEYSDLKGDVDYLEAELTHDRKLWDFRSEVQKNGSSQEFDEVQAGVIFIEGSISVHSAVCETTT